MTIRVLHLLHYLYFHVLKWTGLFLNEHKTEQESLVFVKRMMAVAVSSITYLRGIFPEDAYRSRYLEDLCIKVLREECSNSGANKIVKWNNEVEMHVPLENTKRASMLLIRKLFLLMQNLDILPNKVYLTMKLYYYDDITPAHYQPPGFKEGECDSLWFEGKAVHFRVGEVQTAFHTLKVRVSAKEDRLKKLQEGQQLNGTVQASQGDLPSSKRSEVLCKKPCDDEKLPSEDESAQFKKPMKSLAK
ncbi:HORMA domain-containing protein 1, partial [Takifugu flavidus]